MPFEGKKAVNKPVFLVIGTLIGKLPSVRGIELWQERVCIHIGINNGYICRVAEREQFAVYLTAADDVYITGDISQKQRKLAAVVANPDAVTREAGVA